MDGPAITHGQRTELICDTLEKWAKRRDINLLLIQLGKPMQNGYIERFNRTFREQVLNCRIFETLGEVRGMTADRLTGTTSAVRMSRSATSHRRHI